MMKDSTMEFIHGSGWSGPLTLYLTASWSSLSMTMVMSDRRSLFICEQDPLQLAQNREESQDLHHEASDTNPAKCQELLQLEVGSPKSR